MQFLFAMNRRGVAFKFARLMTFEQHSTFFPSNAVWLPPGRSFLSSTALFFRPTPCGFRQVVQIFEQHSTEANFLIQAMQRESPPRYAKPSLHQIMLCDKAAFTRLESSISSVRQAQDGSFPLGLRLLELRNDPTIAAPCSLSTASCATTFSAKNWSLWR